MTGHYETAAEDDNGNGGFGSGGSDNFACDVRVRELCVCMYSTYPRKKMEERENNSAFVVANVTAHGHIIQMIFQGSLRNLENLISWFPVRITTIEKVE